MEGDSFQELMPCLKSDLKVCKNGGSGKKEAGNFEAEKKGLISRLYKIMRYKPHEI